MELNNFENSIKTELVNRKIRPSKEARERLGHLLTKPLPTKKKSPWLLWTVAASVLVGLLLTGIYRFTDLEILDNPSKISHDKNLDLDENKGPSSSKDEFQNSVVNSDTNDHSHLTLEFKTKTSVIFKKDQITLENRLLPKSELSNNKNQSEFMKTENNKPGGFEIVGVNGNTVMDDIIYESNIQKDYTYITPEELITAIENDSNLNLKSTLKLVPNSYVDPKGLLTEMESQLFNEANSGVLHKVGKQLKKMKEAVANRNHE